MKGLELKIPPVLVMFLFILLMWALDSLLSQYSYDWPWHKGAAIGVFILAVGLISAGVYSFRKAKTTVNPTIPEAASSMVNSGIFGYTRNPMYLGFLLILVAYAFKFSNLATLVALPLFVIYLNQFQIKPEERVLIKLFGDEYRDYCKKVRRWI